MAPKRRKTAVIILFFAAVYCSISLVNHYLFRTDALDLGMFNHAIFDFAHGEQNTFMLGVRGEFINYFGDHFSPITALLSPLYYLFGSYALLIAQIGFVLLGGIGVLRYAELHLKQSSATHWIMVLFLFSWGIFSALSYDFHTNVIAAMLVPWLFVFHKRRRWSAFIVVFLTILLCKENMALWMIFILLGLLFKRDERSLGAKMQLEGVLLLFSAIYFVVVVGFVMPHISGGMGTNQLARYGHIGDSIGAIIVHCVTHPWDTIQLFWENTTQDPNYDGIKAELHLMVLCSGGIALLLQPRFLLMLVPIYGQKLLSADYGFWGINGQYSIEFAPILALAAVHMVAALSGEKSRVWIARGLTTLTVVATMVTLNSRKSKWYNKTNSAFYSKTHYSAGVDLTATYSVIEQIPNKVSISTSSCLAPHLAFRDSIFLFPIGKQADVVALFYKNRSTYPLSREAFDKEIESLLNDPQREITFQNHELIVFQWKDQ